MRRALRPNPRALHREVSKDVRELNVGVASLKKLDEMSSELRIVTKFRHALTSTTSKLRLSVARAPAGDPVILLADEPTGNLDSANGEAVMELLADLHQNGATICMVTHDTRYARHAQRSINLFDGRMVAVKVAS